MSRQLIATKQTTISINNYQTKGNTIQKVKPKPFWAKEFQSNVWEGNQQLQLQTEPQHHIKHDQENPLTSCESIHINQNSGAQKKIRLKMGYIEPYEQKKQRIQMQ